MAWKALKALFDREGQMYAPKGTVMRDDDPVAMSVNPVFLLKVSDELLPQSERSEVEVVVVPVADPVEADAPTEGGVIDDLLDEPQADYVDEEEPEEEDEGAEL